MAIYTAHEMREMASHLIDICDTGNECNEYRNAIGSYGMYDCESALRQAAAAEEELAELREQINRAFGESVSLKSRLEAVVNMLANVNHECRYSNAVSMLKDEYDAILRVARGEGDAE